MLKNRIFNVIWNESPKPDEELGLYHGVNHVSNVIPTLEKIQKVISSSGVESFNYWVHLKDASGTDYGVKAVTSLSHLPYFNLWGCSDALMTSREKAYHLAKLQEDSSFLTPEIIFDGFSGLLVAGGHHNLIWGNEIWGDEANTLPTISIAKYDVRKLEVPEDLDKESFMKIQLAKHLNFWPDVTEPLFYSALHAITKMFLVNMNVDSGHLTLLVGPPGHLKTTLAKQYCLWCEKTEAQQTTFQERKEARVLLDTVRSYVGQNYLADDLHSIAAYYDAKKQKKRLDELSRIASSGAHCAGIIVTGESVMDLGIFSCLDRILQIKVPKLSSSALAEKKNSLKELHPNFMPEIAREFAKQLIYNYNEVVKDIETFLSTDKVSLFEDNDHTMRVGRHAMLISLTESLFRKYCCNGSSELSKAKELHAALHKICRSQEEELHQHRKEDEHDYVLDLLKIFDEENDQLNIVSVPHYYTPDDITMCFYKQNKFYITELALTNAYFNLLNKAIDIKKVEAQMRMRGILDMESRSTKKRFHGVYHYVISDLALKLYEKTVGTE